MLSLMPVNLGHAGEPPHASGPATSSPHLNPLLETTMNRTTTTTRRARRWAHRDPRWMTERDRIAGEVLRMCAKTQQAISIALGRADDLGSSEAWVSRLANGHPSVGVHLQRVEALAASKITDAAPLAGAPYAVMCRVMAERFDDVELEHALICALQLEVDREGAENSLQCRRLIAGDLPAEDVAEVEDELARAFVLSMAVEATATGIMWERRRRRLRRGH